MNLTYIVILHFICVDFQDCELGALKTLWACNPQIIYGQVHQWRTLPRLCAQGIRGSSGGPGAQLSSASGTDSCSAPGATEQPQCASKGSAFLNRWVGLWRMSEECLKGFQSTDPVVCVRASLCFAQRRNVETPCEATIVTVYFQCRSPLVAQGTASSSKCVRLVATPEYCLVWRKSWFPLKLCGLWHACCWRMFCWCDRHPLAL